MTFSAIAYIIFKERKSPLSAKKILIEAKKRGLVQTKGKTPEATMAAIIYTDIKKKGKESKFQKVGNVIKNHMRKG